MPIFANQYFKPLQVKTSVKHSASVAISTPQHICLRAFVPIPKGFDSQIVFSKASDVQSIAAEKLELSANCNVSRSALKTELEDSTFKAWGDPVTK